MDEFVYYGPQAPPVHRFAMPHLVDDFGCQVLRSPTHRKGLEVAFNIISGEPEVSEFDVAVGPDENILWFEAG